MKLRKTNPRLLCYLSAAAFALSSCSQNTTKIKPTIPSVADNVPDGIPSSGSQSRLFHYSKRGVRQVKIADTRRSKRVQYEYANLWERLFDSYALPEVRNQAVERELAWFVNHPTYLQRAQQRAEPFLYNIVQQIERQGVPGELALLPVVESAFQAQAVSPAKAAGIWQFIPATGRHYGLKQNHSYDGRRDVYASTKAAIKYLKKLNRQFNGDWLLAVAAYNCGEGAVEKAIQRNIYRGLPTDFWSLDLPQETRSYVPRLMAVSRLFADSDRFGVDLRYIPNEAVFKPVKISHQLDLALAADAADMSLDEFRAINPGFKNTFVDPDGPVRLFVPAHKSKTFKKELARLASTQSDLLHKEFDRTRSSAEEIMSVRTDNVASGNGGYRPRLSELRGSEPFSVSSSVSSRLRPISTPSPKEREPAPVRTDTVKTYEAAYEQRSVSPNPFQPPFPPSSGEKIKEYAPTEIEEPRDAMVSKARYAAVLEEPYSPAQPFQATPQFAADEEVTEAAPVERKQTTARKARRESAPVRTSHVTRHHAPVQPAVKKTERRASKPVQKPPVSYKYSTERVQEKPAAKGHAGPSLQTAKSPKALAQKPAKLAEKPGKLAVASAGSSVKLGQPAKYKASESPSKASNTQRPSGKSTDSRKSDRIVTAKAETPRTKGRR